MKKYDNKSNVISNLIKSYREKRHFTKGELSRKLELHGVSLDVTELGRIESGKMIVKDFELIGLCKVLNIDYKDILNAID